MKRAPEYIGGKNDFHPPKKINKSWLPFSPQKINKSWLPFPPKKRKRRSTGAKTGGPTSHAASKKRRLADYWDLHHTTETMETLAK